MDLESFIKEALVQISNGVEQANEDLKPKRVKKDGAELPKLFLLAPGVKKEHGHGVHFDVAVTTHSIDEGKGGVKFKLAIAEANLGGKIKSSEKAISRVQFSVNINQWHG